MKRLFYKKNDLSHYLLMLPGLLWMTVFVIIPLLSVIIFSFFTSTGYSMVPKFTIESYRLFFKNLLYPSIALFTLRTTVLTLLIALILGYPVAYYIGLMVKNPRNKIILLVLCIVPFWTSYLIRTIAWIPMLGQSGLINQVLLTLGIVEKPISAFLYSEFGMILAIVQIYIVFLVGPIAFSLSRIEQQLIDASHDLGASPLRTFSDIILPLSKPGIVTGSIFFFVMVMGEFATPNVIGGGKTPFLGNVVITQVYSVQWPFAAVNAIVLIAIVTFGVSLLLRVVDIRKEL